MIREPVPELFHHYLGGWFERRVRNPVETNEVDSAFKSFKQTYEGVSMSLVIIDSGEHGVLETHPPLPSEIIFMKELYHIIDRPSLLHWHQSCPFFREWTVEAYRQMTAGRIQEFPEIRQDSDSRKGYPLGAPSEPPV